MLEFLEANFVYFFFGGIGCAMLAIIAFFLNFMRVGKRMDQINNNPKATFGTFFRTMFGGFVFVPLFMLAGSLCEILAVVGFILYIIDKVNK